MGKRAREQRRAAQRSTVAAVLPPAPAPVEPPPVVSPEARRDALLVLGKTIALERSMLRRRDRQVLAARAAGATWAALAEVLGVTPQAVQKRYGSRGSDA